MSRSTAVSPRLSSGRARTFVAVVVVVVLEVAVVLLRQPPGPPGAGQRVVL